jgi:hypothetical protein
MWGEKNSDENLEKSTHNTDYDRSKTAEECECFNYLGSITNDARGTRGIKFGIAMVKAAFNKKKDLFTSKLVSNLRKTLVWCYIWSRALYGAET